MWLLWKGHVEFRVTGYPKFSSYVVKLAENTELNLGQRIRTGVRSEQDQHRSDIGESKLRSEN